MVPQYSSSALLASIFVVALAAQGVSFANAFVAPDALFRTGNSFEQNHQWRPTSLHSRNEDAAEEDGKASLVFLVEVNVSSDPLPPETTTEEIKSFLEKPRLDIAWSLIKGWKDGFLGK